MIKNQHYIPRFYLKNFAASDSMLSVIRIESGKPGCVFRCKPDGICSEKYLHEVKNRLGGAYFEEGAIEGMLSQLESRLAPNYEDLLRRLSDGAFIDSSDYDELTNSLMAFIASLVVRHPKWLGPERDKAPNLISLMFEKEAITQNDVDTLGDIGVEVDLPAIVELAIMDTALFSTAERAPLMQLVDMLKPMNIAFLAAPEERDFIATSFPLHVEWRQSEDADPVSVYLPLSSRFAVMFHRYEPISGIPVRVISGKDVDHLNRILVGGSGLNDMAFGVNGSYLASIVSAAFR